jgi:hypothetical protein
MAGFGLALFCAGCHRSDVSANSKESTAPISIDGATIKASPNPVPSSASAGTTTISWSSHEGGPADVYVSHSGKPEQLVAKGASGSKTITWIQAGFKYDFSLYERANHRLLAKVQVTRPE